MPSVLWLQRMRIERWEMGTDPMTPSSNAKGRFSVAGTRPKSSTQSPHALLKPPAPRHNVRMSENAVLLVDGTSSLYPAEHPYPHPGR